jgi:hypothetical protein
MSSGRPKSMFSSRAFLAMPITAALVTGIVLLLSDTGLFSLLFSPHGLAVSLPIICLVVGIVVGIFYGRPLALLSLAVFCVALAVPALRFAGDLFPGCVIFLFSFFGAGNLGDWKSTGSGCWTLIACAIAALANISFIVGYLALLLFANWQKGIPLGVLVGNTWLLLILACPPSAGI